MVRDSVPEILGCDWMYIILGYRDKIGIISVPTTLLLSRNSPGAGLQDGGTAPPILVLEDSYIPRMTSESPKTLRLPWPSIRNIKPDT